MILPESYIQHIILYGTGAYYEDLGGYYVGVIDATKINQSKYLLILSDKSIGEDQMIWKNDLTQTGGKFSVLDGYYNTQLLLKSHHPAKEFCNDINTTNRFTDWYIPAINELRFIQKHNPDQLAKGVFYWSSTESSKAETWAMASGVPGRVFLRNKLLTNHLRLVRRVLVKNG